MGHTRTWQRVGVDSVLERGRGDALVAVPHHGAHLEMLPFDTLSWSDFESLQWWVLRDVEGLRHAQIYGDPGQNQRGLDIVALAADDSGVALQSKRVKKFGPADLTGAVEAFRQTTRPFDVSRFILGVSREVRSTQTIDRLRQFQEELRPIELELWDQRVLSYKLKDAPQIVIEYFGNEIAEIFCDQFTVGRKTVPAADVMAIRQAIARTPEVVTGAGEKISQATTQAETDPIAALALVEEAQEALTKAGFAGHAAKHETLRASLLVAVGRGAEATRRQLDQLWIALDHGQTTSADMAYQGVSKFAGQANSEEARKHLAVADRALDLYNNPLASVPCLTDLLTGDPLDRARLAALAGETALAAGDHQWLKMSAVLLQGLAADLPVTTQNDTLRTRLRILSAEGCDGWTSVLDDARKLKLDSEVVALVQARYARHLALNQKFEGADASWDEATNNACLAAHWTDASRWVFSRRAFRNCWKPFTSNELLPIETALSTRGPDQSVLPRMENALEYAYGRLANDKLRSAAITAQRALRDAVTLSDWEGERQARRLLAEVLRASGEHLMAANHLVLAGEINALKRLGAECPTRFLDVTPYLDATPWWVVGAAYRLIAAQADLVPDDLVPLIADRVLADLEAASGRTLIDLSRFTGSRYLGAIAALAGISERLSLAQADHALSYFEGQPPLDPGQYRFQDKDEAMTVAGILTTHVKLEDRALTHLVGLLGRSSGSRNATTSQAVIDRIPQARTLLGELAEMGITWARETLDSEYPEKASDAQLQEARARLEEPLTHDPGVLTIGSASGSIPDSILVRTLPEPDQQAALSQLIERGGDPYVSSSDRAQYLIAASNLRPPTDETERTRLFSRALTLVLSPPEYVEDTLNAPLGHPLGAFRVNGIRDSRGQAAHLAATLASTTHEKERVRAAVLGLIGDETVSEVWATHALQRLGATMAPDVGFLSGLDWALRSFSATLWAKTTQPEPVGYRLATDADVRVRRTFAMQLVLRQAEDERAFSSSSSSDTHADQRRHETRAAILKILRDDPCFSVRVAAAPPVPSN